jgi:hypothetical protein
VKLSLEGGGGLPPERAGRTGTSDRFLEDGGSAGLVMPSPAFSCAVAAVVDDVRSGWPTVGVVGDGIDFSLLEMEAEGFSVEALRESPRAGRSTTRLELKDDSDVSGESCEPIGGEDVKVGSIRGRLSLADMSALLGELNSCCCTGGDEVSSESLRLASAFLFLGTSCSLKGSWAEGAGEACWLLARGSAVGDSFVPSFLFLSVSTSVSEGCLPFSWKAMCGLCGCRRSFDASRELFSLSFSRWSPAGLLK